MTSLVEPDERGVMFSLSSILLSWYSGRQRKLQWRQTRDPYRVWVSEIMLQQTQVKTVMPYYDAFLQRFPTVESLASVEEVLTLWSGLGYYRRARQMHLAAQQVAAGGAMFPSSTRELMALPGIGPYTAAAIASIAFGEVVPVLDGNVERVLSRFLALEGNPKHSAMRKRLLEAASLMLDAERPGDSNQALMELGATVCRPKVPECRSCPLQEGCQAHLSGEPLRYPTPKRRRATLRIEMAVALTEERGRVLLFRRPEDSVVLPGMWELPSVRYDSQIRTLEQRLSRVYGGQWQLDSAIDTVTHQITHRALTVHVFRARFEAEDSVGEGPEAAWVSLDSRKNFPSSSLVEKILLRSIDL